MVIEDIIQRLSERYDEPVARQQAWWILEAVTGTTRAHLMTERDIVLTGAQRTTLNQWLDQHLNEHKPLQYILGWVPFCGLRITVRPPTLIPRPETEEWCARLITLIRDTGVRTFSLFDLCTGSGCVALALAKAFPDAHIYASDIDEDALALARENAQQNTITNVTFVQSDLFEAFRDQCFDIIVANPPYISQTEWESLAPSVRKWESKKALVASHEGRSLIEQIIDGAARHLRAHELFRDHNVPMLVIEIGYRQAAPVSAYMREHGYTSVHVWHDVAGKDRVVCGRVAHVVDTTNH